MNISELIRDYIELKIEGPPKNSEWSSMDANRTRFADYYEALKNIERQIDQAAIAAASALERNFCERCGKRLGDIESIHTCTPPSAVVPCQNESMGQHACKNRAQCWEPCGELGHSAEHALVNLAGKQP